MFHNEMTRGLSINPKQRSVVLCTPQTDAQNAIPVEKEIETSGGVKNIFNGQAVHTIPTNFAWNYSWFKRNDNWSPGTLSIGMFVSHLTTVAHCRIEISSLIYIHAICVPRAHIYYYYCGWYRWWWWCCRSLLLLSLWTTKQSDMLLVLLLLLLLLLPLPMPPHVHPTTQNIAYTYICTNHAFAHIKNT